MNTVGYGGKIGGAIEVLEALDRPSPHLTAGGGHGMARRKLTAEAIEARFWARVNKTDSCWLWIGTIDKGGYGLRHVSDANGRPKHHQAHRDSWEMHFGPIPAGLLVCHHCDVRNCVRPDHLFLGTDLTNAQDRDRKGRGKRCIANLRLTGTKGEDHALSKLTVEIVKQIRGDSLARGRSGRARRIELAKSIGVSESCIRDVINGRRWSHV